ncbi:MAG: hypothetical protein ACI3XM_00530 [Eubacteriales bacterium]
MKQPGCIVYNTESGTAIVYPDASSGCIRRDDTIDADAAGIVFT